MNIFDRSIQEKNKTADRLLHELYLLVHLNTAAEGLVIPDHLKKEPVVTLKLSRQFRGIMNLHRDRIEAELTFSGELFNCVIPYTSVWGMTSAEGKTFFWADSAPQMVQEPISSVSHQQSNAEKSSDEPKPPQPPRPGLKLVKKQK